MMKTIISIFVLMIGLSITAMKAQPSMDPKEMAKSETEWMKKDLSLTDKQIPVVDSLNLAISKERQKIFESANGDFDGIRASMEKLDTDQQAKMKKVLTDEQFKLYVTKRSERRPGPGGPGGPQ